MAKNISLRYLQRTAARFCNIHHENELATFLEVPQHQLQLLALHPQYNIFSVPKKNGKKRWIEDPEDRLQAVQDKLAFYFNAVYYFRKTAAAYGFILSVKNEKDPRHIVTNAAQHLNKAYLFNADMQDFFHQVKEARLEKIFSKNPFGFSDRVVALLVDLCTHQGRLPMGAPTSPVLSNFATIELDIELLTLAQWAEWRYTRYADDLSFSSDTPFKETEIEQIKGIVTAEGFQFNSSKYQHLGPDDRKIVTGVQLGAKGVEVPDGFLEELEKELKRLGHVTEVAHRMGRREKWVERFRQQVTGKVNFVTQVLNADHETSIALADELELANNPPDPFGSQSWLDFGYF